MNHVKFETATRLKEAGFPQPEPEARQSWYYPVLSMGALLLVWVGARKSESEGISLFNESECDYYSLDQITQFGVFAPDLEDITAILPSGFTLEMWDGRHSCKIDTDQNLIRTQAGNFAEAAALAWIALNTPQ